MEGLKAFQVDTVEYVFERMYGKDPVHKFLVADEVGLGKTLVARGLIAKVIDYQRAAGVKRIDIVYICSSADIAQQNVAKLNVTGQKVFSRATRLTKLAGDLHELKSGDVNLDLADAGDQLPPGRHDRPEGRACPHLLAPRLRLGLDAPAPSPVSSACSRQVRRGAVATLRRGLLAPEGRPWPGSDRPGHR